MMNLKVIGMREKFTELVDKLYRDRVDKAVGTLNDGNLAVEGCELLVREFLPAEQLKILARLKVDILYYLLVNSKLSVNTTPLLESGLLSDEKACDLLTRYTDFDQLAGVLETLEPLKVAKLIPIALRSDCLSNDSVCKTMSNAIDFLEKKDLLVLIEAGNKEKVDVHQSKKPMNGLLELLLNSGARQIVLTKYSHKKWIVHRFFCQFNESFISPHLESLEPLIALGYLKEFVENKSALRCTDPTRIFQGISSDKIIEIIEEDASKSSGSGSNWFLELVGNSVDNLAILSKLSELDKNGWLEARIPFFDRISSGFINNRENINVYWMQQIKLKMVYWLMKHKGIFSGETVKYIDIELVASITKRLVSNLDFADKADVARDFLRHSNIRALWMLESAEIGQILMTFDNVGEAFGFLKSAIRENLKDGDEEFDARLISLRCALSLCYIEKKVDMEFIASLIVEIRMKLSEDLANALQIRLQADFEEG